MKLEADIVLGKKWEGTLDNKRREKSIGNQCASNKKSLMQSFN